MTLERFVEAQATVYDQALAELRAGDKRTHWMWFVLPQLVGLGSTPMAQRYAIQDLDEARAYLAHPVLGPRLRECAQALAGLPGSDAEAVMKHPDHLKLRSSMTLFSEADPDEPVFIEVLEKYYEGPDPRTLELLCS